MKSLFFGATLLFAVMVAVASPEVVVRLSDRAMAVPLSPYGRLEEDASGADTLVVDTLRGGVWNPAFRTAESHFKPGKSYEISFRCVIEEQVPDAYILLLMRPADVQNCGPVMEHRPGKRVVLIVDVLPVVLKAAIVDMNNAAILKSACPDSVYASRYRNAG